MSDIKCPFCEQWLIPCIQNQNDWIYHCDNPKCPMYDDADIENAKHPLASEDLWQELIRTRKALEIAVDALTRCQNNTPDNYTATQAVFLLAQNSVFIDKALEQKDK